MPDVQFDIDLPDNVRARALGTATEILGRLADESILSAAATSTEHVTGNTAWDPTSLYSGAPGFALVFTTAAQAGRHDSEHWMGCAHRWFRVMANATQVHPAQSASMAAGTAGIALAVSDAAAVDPRYQQTLAGLHRTLAKQVDSLASVPTEGLGFWHYDVIMGPAGILGYLTALSENLGDSDTRHAERALVDALVRLTDLGWLGWRIPRQNYPQRPIEHELYPHGYADLGLAHGLPGPLAALSRARLNGDHRPRVRVAIERLAAQLVEVSRFSGHGRAWPRVVPFDAAGKAAPERTAANEASYCYGAPGICSALLDAADALGDRSLEAIAIEGFDAVARQVASKPQYRAPGLCHGVAGLLLISHKFAARRSCPAARTMTVSLTQELLKWCNFERPLVVQDYKPTEVGAPNSPLANSPAGAWLDDPGLLEGAAGVAMTLLSVATDMPADWSRSMLVGGMRQVL